MELKPLADRIVIKVAKAEEQTKSGIYIPNTSKEKPQEGTVIAVGSGRITDDGRKVVPEVKIGDHIIFSKYSGSEITLDNEKLLILSENDILAIIED